MLGTCLSFDEFCCRYDDEKSRYRASKKASLLSMLEDGYMDANVAANESKVDHLTNFMHVFVYSEIIFMFVLLFLLQSGLTFWKNYRSWLWSKC